MGVVIETVGGVSRIIAKDGKRVLYEEESQLPKVETKTAAAKKEGGRLSGRRGLNDWLVARLEEAKERVKELESKPRTARASVHVYVRPVLRAKAEMVIKARTRLDVSQTEETLSNVMSMLLEKWVVQQAAEMVIAEDIDKVGKGRL